MRALVGLALFVLIVCGGFFAMFRFTESGRFIWEARIGGMKGPRVGALKPPCAEAVEFDQAWVKQDPSLELWEVMCRVDADAGTPDCAELIGKYRQASATPLPRVTLFVVDPDGKERCSVATGKNGESVPVERHGAPDAGEIDAGT